jgi:hypothetical protein
MEPLACSRPPSQCLKAHALTYALVMALSSTPREEIDALCQVTYELLNKEQAEPGR